MKNTLRPSLSVLVGVLFSCALLCQQALAIPVTLNTPGSSFLASSAAPGNKITVDWEVSTHLNPGFYTYEYQVINAPEGTSPTTSIDFLNVGVNPAFVIAHGGGNFSQVVAGGVDWFPPPIPNGGSSPALNTPGVLYFTSLLPPDWGNAVAQDSNPPSPWQSFPNGQQVPVPVTYRVSVPDGGLTLGLLGLAMMGIEGLRRKLGR